MHEQEAIRRSLDALREEVAELRKAAQKRDELWDEMMPILKEALAVGAEHLGELEARGYFAFGRELLGVVDSLVRTTSPEDLRELAQSTGAIAGALKSLTQPQVLRLVSEIGDAAEHADELKPVGLLGMARAGRDEDAQRGMAVMIEVVRRLGRGVKKEMRRQRLASHLGPSRPRPARSKRPEEPRKRPARAPAARQPAPPRHDSSPPRATPQAAAGGASRVAPPELAGVALTPEGFLVDANQWTKPLAEQLAARLGVALTAQHYQLIESARAEYARTGLSPNVRRLSSISGLSTKEIYSLFPKAPGKSTALIAGLPKPVGCI